MKDFTATRREDRKLTNITEWLTSVSMLSSHQQSIYRNSFSRSSFLGRENQSLVLALAERGANANESKN